MTESEMINIQNWFNKGIDYKNISDHFCENRFIFNSRLSSYEFELKKILSEQCAYLVLASIGEIGNNCFDHNLGHWQDKPGCLFIRSNRYCLIADRGRGIKQSLSNVVKVENDKYVDFAYTHVVSGRAPERRGNGLKFVKKSITTCNTSIYTISDSEIFKLGNDPIIIENLTNQGVLTILSW